MTTAVQHRRGTTAEHATFTGLEGEVTIDTTKDTAVIHDGVLAGGVPLARENLANVTPSGLATITGASTASDDKFFIYDQSATTLKSITRAELNNAMEIDALANVTITGGTINGTTIGNTTAAAGTFTSITNTGGTANGVTYLNGSKVLTTGSALTFDGTNLQVSGTTGFNWVANGASAALVTIGTQGTGGSLFVNTPSANSSYASGLAIDGTYSSPSSVVNLKAVGVNSGGSYNSSLAFHTSFETTLAERMRIGSGGDISFYEDTGTTAKFFWDASAESLGIGTNSPAQKLSLLGTSTFNGFGSGPQITMADTLGRTLALVAPGSVVDAYVGTTTNHTLNFMTGGTGRAVIDTSGNLGIGTSSPTDKLSVGTSAGGTQVKIQSGSGVNNCILHTNGTTDSWRVGMNLSLTNGSYEFYDDINNVTRLILDSSGNLGLGVTPSAWFSGYSVLQLGAFGTVSATSSYVGIGSNAYATSSVGWGSPKYIGTGYAPLYLQQVTNGQHQWYTAPSGDAGEDVPFTQAMTLTAGGNLGIGTPLPSHKLDVSGNVRSTGTFTSTYAGGLVFNAGSATTGYSLININNTTGGMSLGVEGSTNGGYWTGSVAYNTVFASNQNIQTIIGYNNVVQTLVSTGAIVLRGGNTSADGTGITFPATQSASSDANTLDDYEEGNWTPIFLSDGGTTGTQTNTNSWGKYVKVGRQVTVWFKWSGTLSGYTGTLHVSGLPFSVGASTDAYQHGGNFYSVSSTATASNGSNFLFFAYSGSLYPLYTTGQSGAYLFTGSSSINGLTQFNGSHTYYALS